MTVTDRSITDRRRPWLRLVLGLVWFAAAAWTWGTRAGVLLSDHPAYVVLVTVAGAVGLVLLTSSLSAWNRHRRPRPRRRRALVGTAAVVGTLVVVGSLVYLRPFAASPAALDALAGSDDVRVTTSPTRITLTPTGDEPSTGLVFQPGARVDSRAYVPLLSRISEAGYLVVIVKQPLDIAFTAIGAPGGIIDDHPEIVTWAVGGHSLGGVAASSYAGDHRDQVRGLLLWASYPLGSLAGRDDLRVTSVSGTRDGLATPDDIQDSRADLPPGTEFVAVDGGVHAFFGDYGEQPGDGAPSVSREVAQQQIIAATVAFMAKVAAA